jgi:branched-chain amino acid aminotransferase
VYTPPLSSGCLPGITREVLLGEIRAPGIRVEEKSLQPGDLEAADEVFITSTTRDLLPVFQIEDKKVGRTDHTRQALARAFSEFVKSYVAARKAVVA